MNKPYPIDPIKKAREHVRNETCIIRKHAIERQKERLISIADVLYVLERGFHEEAKTQFDVKHQTWKYAIRGKTLDGTELRVIVAFAEELAVITVINLTGKR